MMINDDKVINDDKLMMINDDKVINDDKSMMRNDTLVNQRHPPLE